MLYSRSILVSFFVFSLILIVSLIRIIPKNIETSQNKKMVADRINKLQLEADGLNSKIDKLKTDYGVEEDLRSKFGVVKEGENMIVIVDDQKDKANDQIPENRSFWQFLKGFFGK